MENRGACLDLPLTDGGEDALMNSRLLPKISGDPETKMSFEEALAAASRDQGFKATVYAMNTLLIRKGVYTEEEFQLLFVEWVKKELKRKKPGGAK